MPPTKRLMGLTLLVIGTVARAQGVEDVDLLKRKKKAEDGTARPDTTGLMLVPVQVRPLSTEISIEIMTAQGQMFAVNPGTISLPAGDVTVRAVRKVDDKSSLTVEYPVTIPGNGITLPLPRALSIDVGKIEGDSFFYGPTLDQLPETVNISVPGHSGRTLPATLQGLGIEEGRTTRVHVPKSAKVFGAYDTYYSTQRRAKGGKLITGVGIGAGVGMLTFGLTRFMSSRSLAAEAEAIDDPTMQSDFNDLSSSAKSADTQGKLLMLAGTAVTAAAFTYMFGPGKKPRAKFKEAKANLEAMTPIRLADHAISMEPSP